MFRPAMSQAPADIALWIIKVLKPPHHGKVTTEVLKQFGFASWTEACFMAKDRRKLKGKIFPPIFPVGEMDL